MRTEYIDADTIDAAAERILIKLKEGPRTARSISSRNNVFYFDGWDRLGASAVLQAVARRLTAAASAAGSSVPTGLEFEQVLHIDCSRWKSRRELQRVVAEQLGLPAEVMDMFDKEDEEDDFRGVAQGSRLELQPVIREMSQHIQKLNQRFLVIFHNGSSEEMDLANCCGFPLSGFSTNKVLWTGRFRFKPRVKVDRAIESAGTTDTFLYAIPDSEQDPKKLWSYLVGQEAEEVFTTQKFDKGPHTHGSMDQAAQVAKCLSYMLELCCRGHQCIDYDLATHGANYLICDGIIKQQQQLGEGGINVLDEYDDGLWRTADALQHEMQLDVEHYQQYVPSSPLARFVESSPYWTSPTYGFTQILDGFIISNGNMFQNYFCKLSVLKLSGCTFNFPSAPFRYCHNLRFLWLDRCQVVEINTADGLGTEDADICRCFQRLWVLDLRYTVGCNHILSARMMDLMTHLRELKVVGAQDWDMGQLQGRLPNMRKLRVQKSSVICSSCSEDDLFSETNKMEVLEFSGNGNSHSMKRMKSLCGPAACKSNSCLETAIVDECHGFTKVSFRGCTNLKNILLRGWLDINTLDISSTAVKTLDLTTTQINYLDELYLLYCEKLRAIMWPPEKHRIKNMPAKLHIDTTQSSTSVLHGSQSVSEFDWYVAIRDARLLVSLEPVYPYPRKIYVEISSTNIATGASEHERIVESGSRSLMPVISTQQQKQPVCTLIYADVTKENQQQGDDESNGDAQGTVCMWRCPEAPHLPKESCYMHIQDWRGAITVPDFVLCCATIMHVKDSLFITILPLSLEYGSEWFDLEWCRIERCPKLECAFERDDAGICMYELRILWASQLPKASYIWKGSGQKVPNLIYLHLDRCPRLIHVLTSSIEGTYGFRCLEPLEIMWCGDLKEVFPLDTESQHYVAMIQPQVDTLEFPKLKRIHLHELPTLHSSICGPGLRMSAPELEIVKIRGCWSLKRLPMVQKKAVQCDYEKEWWDSLQWEDASHKELYEPIHPKHYKKATLLRGTVLR